MTNGAMVPPALTTLAASVAARPAGWPAYVGGHCTPDPGDLRDLPTASAGERIALMLREVQPSDAVVDVHVGRDVVRRQDGLRESGIALLDLDPKAELAVEVCSPDATTLWGKGKLTPQGGPFVPRVHRATRESALRCKGHGRSAVEAELRRRLVVAYDVLEDLEARAARIDAAIPDFGRHRELDQAYEAVSDAAALVGWSDPRIVRLVDRVTSLERRSAEGARRVIDVWQKQPADPPPDLRVLGVDCERRGQEPTPRSACRVTLETSRALWEKDAREATKVVLEDGRTADVHVSGGDRVGETRRCVIRAADVPPFSAQAAPWLLIVRQRGEPARLLPISAPPR